MLPPASFVTLGRSPLLSGLQLPQGSLDSMSEGPAVPYWVGGRATKRELPWQAAVRLGAPSGLCELWGCQRLAGEWPRRGPSCGLPEQTAGQCLRAASQPWVRLLSCPSSWHPSACRWLLTCTGLSPPPLPSGRRFLSAASESSVLAATFSPLGVLLLDEDLACHCCLMLSIPTLCSPASLSSPDNWLCAGDETLVPVPPGWPSVCWGVRGPRESPREGRAGVGVQ